MTNRIKEHRKRLGWTLDKLADVMGTTPQQVSRLERGERGLDDGWLSRLSSALSVPKAHLIYENAGVAPRDRESAKDTQEVRLLAAWRMLSTPDRDAFLRALEALAPSNNQPKARRKA